MRYGSVCSGIEAASVAWESLGWSPAWVAEIAAWPSKFLAQRFPSVPNHGSLVGLAGRLAGDDRRIDLLVGGTPCQAFSVSGLRGGLTDERGNLTLEFARLAAALRPRWLVWENVPGVLSDSTNAFGCLLGALSELGYGLAWRVLDAQFFGVAQRRERVFLVGHLGAAAAAGAVLFEPEGVRRNPPTRGEAREDVAGAPGIGAGGRRRDLDGHGAYVPEISKCLTTSATRLDSETETETFITASFDETQVTSPSNRSSCDPSTAALVKSGRPPAIAFNARQDPVPSEHVAGSLDTDGTTQAVCVTGEVTHALRSVGADASEDGTGRGTPITTTSTRVRRLTPRECERLQGFPDDWTAVNGAKDTPRYAALGNSMAVPAMRWIGERIAKVDAIVQALGRTA
jgi:DNA (cytosine-5)-methyltransferase 1